MIPTGNMGWFRQTAPLLWPSKRRAMMVKQRAPYIQAATQTNGKVHRLNLTFLGHSGNYFMRVRLELSCDQYAEVLASKSSSGMECSPLIDGLTIPGFHPIPVVSGYIQPWLQAEGPHLPISRGYHHGKLQPRVATATASVTSVAGRPSHSPSSSIFDSAFPLSTSPTVPAAAADMVKMELFIV